MPVITPASVFVFPLQLSYQWSKGTQKGIYHAWVYRENSNVLLERAAKRIFQRLFKVSSEELEHPLFNKRLRLFLVDNIPKQQLTVQINSDEFVLSQKTRENGHVYSELELKQDAVDFQKWFSFETTWNEQRNEQWNETKKALKDAPVIEKEPQVFFSFFQKKDFLLFLILMIRFGFLVFMTKGNWLLIPFTKNLSLFQG